MKEGYGSLFIPAIEVSDSKLEQYKKEGSWYFALSEVPEGESREKTVSQLLEPVCPRLDKEGEDCFTVTCIKEDIQLFEKYGFVVAETGLAPDGRTWQFVLYRKAM